MVANITEDRFRARDKANALRGWVMVALTMLFVFLYGAALMGWITPLTDERAVSRLEPIIFVIIGYYFGRLPSERNESALKEEINRQAQKADAAQHAKEQAQQARESLEEKLKSIRAVLAPSAPGVGARSHAESPDKTSGQGKEDGLRQSVAAAISILNA
jgi:hypothetical protein